MRAIPSPSRRSLSGTLAVVATAGLLTVGGTAVASGQVDTPTGDGSSEPTVTHEKGVIIDCGGEWRRKHVYASLYENSAFGNHLQVVVDDGDYSASRQPKRKFVRDDRVRARFELGGKPARIKGLARLDGTRTPVYELLEDAGQTIETKGVHRGLDTNIAFHWRGHAVKLDCSESVRYRLTVTRTPIEEEPAA